MCRPQPRGAARENLGLGGAPPESILSCYSDVCDGARGIFGADDILAKHGGGLSIRDSHFDLPQQRHDLLRFVSPDWHVQLSFRVILSHSRWTKSSPSGQCSLATMINSPSERRISKKDSTYDSSRSGAKSVGPRLSRYSKLASRRESDTRKFLQSMPGISKCTSADEAPATLPWNHNVTRPVAETSTLADSLSHLFNCEIASTCEERTFCLLAKKSS
jgi:hypothetical protein